MVAESALGTLGHPWIISRGNRGFSSIGKMPRTSPKRLTKRQLAALKQRLVSEETKLVAMAHSTIRSAMSRDPLTGDEADESADELMRSDEFRLRDRERTKLAKIRKALVRIESGAYNECEECGEPIGHERLSARPVATLCIGCKVEQEHRERLRADQSGGSRPVGWR